MITKEQFEARVRAEAEKEYRSFYSGHVGFPDDRNKEREAYVKTRMEHEWPLAEALDRYAMHPEDCHTIAMWIPDENGKGEYLGTGPCNCGLEQALAPYTAKPTEQP